MNRCNIAFREGAFEQAKEQLRKALEEGNQDRIDIARYWFREHRKALKQAK